MIGNVLMAAGAALGLYVYWLMFTGYVSAFDPRLVAVMIERLILAIFSAALFISGAVFVAAADRKQAKPPQ